MPGAGRIALLVLLALVFPVTGQFGYSDLCQIDPGESTPPCLLNVGSGKIDLRPLDEGGSAKPVFNVSGSSASSDESVYFFYNPCRPFTTLVPNGTQTYECYDVLLCEQLEDTNKSTSNFYNLGDTSDDVSCAVDSAGVHLLYNIAVGDQQRSTRVYIKCDESVEQEFTPRTKDITNTTQQFVFELRSKYGCVVTPPEPPPPHKGMSTGSLLLLIAFVGITAYFILGMLVRFLCVGARGMEVIPNLDFWKDVPLLIVGGMLFFKDIICCNTSKPNYDEI